MSARTSIFKILGQSGWGLIVALLMLAFSQPAQSDWGKNFGGLNGGNVSVTAIAVDGSGNTYIAGALVSTSLALVGGITLTRIGTQDAFAAKIDSSGAIVWAKNYGGVGAGAKSNSIAVDGSGNVYLGGSFYTANLTTPALTKIGTQDAFAMKLDASGNTTWSKAYGGAGAGANGNSIAVDGSGNVYLGGSFQTANLTTPALTKIGVQDAFVFKLDASGNTTWSKGYGGSSANGDGKSVAVDGSGNVYLGGVFSGNLTTPALTSLGWQDTFAIKLDASGNTTWSKRYGGAGAFTIGHGIAVDSSGNVYLGGYFSFANLTTPALARIGMQDAFAIKLDSSGNTTWSRRYGGSSAQVYPRNIAVDGSGNVYLGGHFGNANLTTPALTRIGDFDTFAIKLDSSGNTTWSRRYGGAGASTFGNSIAVDGSGNVYLGGEFYNANLTTPALTSLGGTDAFVFKLDSSGNTTWAKAYSEAGPGGSISVKSIARDSTGNIYLGGSFNAHKAVFGSTTLTRIGGFDDAFATKIDSSGAIVWAKNFGGALANSYGTSITVDGNGNVYLAGYFQTANLTTPALTKIGIQDAFAIKLDSSGNTTWSRRYGGAGSIAAGNSIAVDGSGNVYLGGGVNLASLTTPVLTKIGDVDAFAIKIDSSGTIVWAKNYGGVGAGTSGSSIAVDGSGNVYLGGYLYGANLTTPALTKIGGTDAFATKIDSSGTIVWAKNYGGSSANVSGNSIAVDGSGNVYLGGHFDSANLTTPVLTKIGTQDAFVIKLNSSGTTTWSKGYGGSSANVSGNSIAVDGSGNVYLGGYFSSANLTTPALTKIGTQDAFAIRLNSSGNTTWSKGYGGVGAGAYGNSIAVDGTGNVYFGGSFQTANLTTPALTKIGTQDALVINSQLFNTTCTIAGKFKYDSSNNVMVFCDGSAWQSMNNSSASTCSGITPGKVQYYSNGVNSDFVWYGSSCRSAKSLTTFGACVVNGKIEWDSGNSTFRGCVNGTWTSLKGW
jgi:hypothetical protein